MPCCSFGTELQIVITVVVDQSLHSHSAMLFGNHIETIFFDFISSLITV